MLEDTRMVMRFMEKFGQTVRPHPTAEITDDERVLRVRLVLEEALEFAEAMGVEVAMWDDQPGNYPIDDIEHLNFRTVADIDLVEAADALGDLIYVTKGSALTMGLPMDDIVEEIHMANMDKLDPITGQRILDKNGKVTKPEGWISPNERIRKMIE